MSTNHTDGPHGNRPSWLASLTKGAAIVGRTFTSRDALRLPVQTVAAVLLAYACMTLLQLPAVAWGAFSALFVVRASVEGTIGEATGRVLGAFIGVAIGISLILVTQPAGLAAPWRIAGGVALAAYISARWPMLSYSLVTVTIITVAPDSDVLLGAGQKALAIVIGSASGILAAVSILPLSARYSMRYNLAASIESYGDVLVQYAKAINDADPRPPLDGEAAVERALGRARDMAGQARSFPLDLLHRRSSAYQLYERIERLWRTLPLMEQAADTHLSPNVCRRLGPGLHDVAAAAKEQVDALAQAVRSKTRPASRPGAREPLQALNGIVKDAIEEGGFDADEQEAVEVIRWAWQVVARELDGLARYLEESRPGAAGTGQGGRAAP